VFSARYDLCIKLRLISSLKAEAWVHFQASECEISCGQSGTGAGFYTSTSLFLC
jgi:hypothetical protein